MRVSILDCGVGNLHSLANAFAKLDTGVSIHADVNAALDTDALVLPGVGAFAAAAAQIAPARRAIREAAGSGLPILGICLGMQLLFDDSEEGSGEGLGVIPGRVERLRARRVPQIGWNALSDVTEPLIAEAGLDVAYFANSYICRPADDDVITAWSDHEGIRSPAAVRSGSVVGVQFHPEKSSEPGLRFLARFLREVRDARGAVA